MLDPSKVPNLNTTGQASYRDFLLVNLPRALAIGGGGVSGWTGGGGGTLDEARSRALESCNTKGAPDCKLYAENLDIVWPGLATHTPPPPGPLLWTTGLADVIIAISPAAHGMGGSTNLTAQYDDLRQIVTAAPPSSTRLAFVQFAADPFAGDLTGRATLIERLRPKLGGLLVLDQPEGFTGHYGGATGLFARRFADCLLRFATEPAPRRNC